MIPRRKKSKNKTTSAVPWLGQPVVVVLNDGSYYIGKLDAMSHEEVTLSSMQAEGRLPAPLKDSEDKAQVSGFLGSLLGFSANMLQGGLGGGMNTVNTFSGANTPNAQQGSNGQAADADNGGGVFGFVGRMIPRIQIGMKMVRMIMPLMALFK